MSTETRVQARTPVYGLMAEFDDPDKLLASARRAHGEGYRNMDAYSPMPIEGLAEAVGFRSRAVSSIVFAAGAAGAIGGFSLMLWITTTAYPLNVAGRPLNSWPAYIPITFECMVLLACLSAVFGMLALNGLPRPYHPVFNAPHFARASRDRFFLCIEADDPRFDAAGTRQFLESLQPMEVVEVDP